MKCYNQENIQKEGFTLELWSQRVRNPFPLQWGISQEQAAGMRAGTAETSHLELQAGNREIKPQMLQVFKLSKPTPPVKYFLQQGHFLNLCKHCYQDILIQIPTALILKKCKSVM